MMIYYTDMLNAPYEKYGNCYGLIVECCRRANKPLKNPFEKFHKMPAGEEIPFLIDLNVKEITSPKAGAIVECLNNGNLHVGYLLTDSLVLHSTRRAGVKTTHIAALRPIKYYEVTE